MGWKMMVQRRIWKEQLRLQLVLLHAKAHLLAEHTSVENSRLLNQAINPSTSKNRN